MKLSSLFRISAFLLIFGANSPTSSSLAIGGIEGWEIRGNVKLNEPGIIGKSFLLKGTSTKPDCEAMRLIPLSKPLPEVMNVSLLVKGEKIDQVSEGTDGVAEVRIAFRDKIGSPIGNSKKLGAWFGTFDWKPWTGTVRIPREAAQAGLSLKLNGAKGKVFFDAVEVLMGFPADQDRQDLIVDGGFEYINTLSDWKFGSGHRVISPGLESRAALQIHQENLEETASSQEIALEEIQKGKSLNFSMNLKLDLLTKRNKGGIEIQLQWSNEKGEGLGKDQILGPWNGSFDWKKISEEVFLPAGARRLTFKIVMVKAKGTALLDDIRLEADGAGEKVERLVESRTDTSSWRPFSAAEGSLKGLLDASALLDAPAGKHGFLGVKEGHFQFVDGTKIRFFGVNIEAPQALPFHKEAELMAERLAQHGFNIVRIHHLDTPWANPNIFDPRFKDTQHLSAESLDRLDYFVAQLKKRGIYVYMDLLVSRLFKGKDNVSASGRLGKGAKIAAEFNPNLIKLQKKYAHDLLTHRNAYTGLRYVDEPAIALVDLINESSMFMLPKKIRTLPEIYLDELEKLRKKYQYQDQDEEEFLSHIQLRYFQELSNFLHDLGLKIPIAGSNLALDDGDLATNASLDFIDRHAYWDHPKGGFGDLAKFNNNSPIEALQRHNLLAKLSRLRVQGKPFVVSEWNIAWPNEYRSVGPLLMAAYANFQDWDGLILFNYDGDFNSVQIKGNFDVSTKPEIFLQFPVASRLFHRRDVARAQKSEVYPISSDVLIPPSLALVHRIERSLKQEEAEKEKRGQSPWVSDTGELTWDAERGFVQIQTPRMEALIGQIGNSAFHLASSTFKVTNPFACLSVTALDNRPINESSHLLLAAVSRAENTGTVYNSSRTLLRSSGTTPLLMEPVTGLVSFSLEGRKGAKVFALDASGKQTSEIKTQIKNGELEIPIGQSSVYEISLESIS